MTQDYSSDASAMNSALVAQFVKKSSTSGLLRNDGSVDTSTHLKSTDIVDNLTTNNASKVLSAKQGKVLKDEIDDILDGIHDIIYGTGGS